MKMVVNATQPVGNRVISIEMLCEQCTPLEYMPINLDQIYRVIAVDFVANGGNGYSVFKMHKQNYE